MSVLSGMWAGCASLQLDSWSWAEQPLLGEPFTDLASTTLPWPEGWFDNS